MAGLNWSEIMTKQNIYNAKTGKYELHEIYNDKYKDWSETESKEHEIREERRRTWTKKGFEELYGKGSYKKILDTISTGEF
jgi:hypothetical protein